jgi:hypothetical protein
MCTENGADAVRSVAPARSCSRLTPRTVRLRRRRGRISAGGSASGRGAPAGPAGFRATLIWRSRPPPGAVPPSCPPRPTAAHLGSPWIIPKQLPPLQKVQGS